MHGIAAASGPVRGQRLALNFFPDAVYTTVVERVRIDVNGVLTLYGRIEGRPFETFVMNGKDGVFLADLTDLAAGRLFRLTHSPGEQGHRVLEYDAGNMPERRDSHGKVPIQ